MVVDPPEVHHEHEEHNKSCNSSSCEHEHEEMDRITQFIARANTDPENRGMVFREMQDYFVQEKPVLQGDRLQFLMLGSEKYRGLLHICGQIGGSGAHFSCKDGLSLLNSLFSIQQTKRTPIFR
jgi:hypothetical protein